MRRVFPLRPSESSLLVSYQNGAYELDADTEADVSSSSSCNLKDPSSTPHGVHRRRRSSTSFSVTFREDNKDLPTLPQKASLESPSSAYPEFVEAASPSPRSSLWTCSFRDDGDSTSFNFSDSTHRRGTSSASSSSSSSITYNPRDKASFPAIPSNTNVSTPIDTERSACEDVNTKIGTKPASCKDTNTILFEAPPAVDTSIKPSLQALKIPKPQLSSQPDTPVYEVPQKVQERMHVKTEAPTSHRQSQRLLSTSKVAARPLQTSANCSCLPRSRETLRSPRSASASSKSYSCGTALKGLTKCLRSNKASKNPQKDRSISFRVSSPTKFSTNLNQLYAPVSPSQDLSSPRGKDEGEKECIIEGIPTVKDLLSSTPSSPVRAYVNGGCDVSEDDQSALKCQSFGADMITDYVRHVHEAGKSLSFRNAREFSSFHYDSDSASSEFKRRPSSKDFTSKAGKASSKFSLSVASNGDHVDRKDSVRPRELFAAEEKNTKNLALLRLEISKLCKDKRLLARELSAEMKARQSEQKAADNTIKHMEEAMEEKLILVEKEHAHAQTCLEKEIERRKKEWSAKLDKIRVEEKKLRDRVTEMALERVELQKCIAFYKEREASLQTQAKNHELSAQAWKRRHGQSEEEALLLRHSFTTVCNKLSDKEQELDLVLQRTKVLERENAEILKEFSRLRRAYADQDSTFEELWQRLLDIMNGASSDDKTESLRRLHGELKVFSVREQALRYEIGVLQSQLFHVKQKNGLDAEEGFPLQEGSRLCSLKDHANFSKKPSVQQKSDASSEVLDNLVKKLESAKQHMRRAEHQLEVKEEEVELLHSTLKERNHAMKDWQDEFMVMKAQRDGLRKQVQQMGHEALQLTLELSDVRKVVEKMEDELMLKEGQISILRDTCSDSDF